MTAYFCKAKTNVGNTLECAEQSWQNIVMLHRHLIYQQFTLAAIDDVIARGKRRDWAELRLAALQDRAVAEKVLRVCRAHIADPYAQRYRFWNYYAERHLT